MFIAQQYEDQMSFEFLNWFIDEYQEDVMHVFGSFDKSEEEMFADADEIFSIACCK